VLWVYGRSDLTVAFYGAKVYPADFEAVILGSPELAPAVGRFQFASLEDANADRTLAIALELAPGASGEGLDSTRIAELFYRGLAAANQDFREVSRMFGASALAVTLHPHGTGPFEGADIRLKNQYVRPA
jgi:phenylacetate-CoA ligase